MKTMFRTHGVFYIRKNDLEFTTRIVLTVLIVLKSYVAIKIATYKNIFAVEIINKQHQCSGLTMFTLF